MTGWYATHKDDINENEQKVGSHKADKYPAYLFFHLLYVHGSNILLRTIKYKL